MVADVDCVVSVTFKMPPIVTATPVIILSVDATPVSPAPSPTNETAVHAPPTFNPPVVVTAAPATLALRVSATITEIYRSPICRTSITIVLPVPTVTATPEAITISGITLTI